MNEWQPWPKSSLELNTQSALLTEKFDLEVKMSLNIPETSTNKTAQLL